MTCKSPPLEPRTKKPKKPKKKPKRKTIFKTMRIRIKDPRMAKWQKKRDKKAQKRRKK